MSRVSGRVTLALAVLFLPVGADSSGDALPEGVFRPWDGEWRGDFVIYSPTGDRRVIQVRHIYRSRDDHHQDGEIHDTLPDGTTVHKTAVNSIEDGQLFCRVYEEDGSLEVEHRGVYVDGHILWSSTDHKGRIRQVFRERVEGDRYFIDGVGIYGSDRQVVEIYTGRYRRVR